MKKRMISLLMAAVILLGMAIVPANAASSLEEAMKDVNVYAKNDDLNWLCMNGSVATQHYTYYLYQSEVSGGTKEIPAYCTDPRLYGVPALVPQGTAIRYGAESTVADAKIMGIVANGYPHIDLGTLGLQSVEEAYYATKTALWCYLLGTWSIDGLTVNPSAGQAAAERVLAATRDIYNRGVKWDKLVEPKLTATPDRDVAYAATVNGQSVYQQIFRITSETWSYYPVTVSLVDGAPSGTQILDMSDNPVSSLDSADATHGSDGYSWQIKVVYPAASVEGQNGTVQLNLSSVVVQYELYHAKCLETDTYGNAQRYVLDTDPHIPISASAISTYSSDPPPSGGGGGDGGGTSIKIIKLEEGTNTPLAGAVFEIVSPDGDSIGTFSTKADGTITVSVSQTGSFSVTELTAPAFHLLPEVRTQHVTVVHGKTAEVTFVDAPFGNLRIEKYSNTGEPLSGVTFQVKHLGTGETLSGQTGPGGALEFFQLKPGGVEVRETAGIEGWQMDTETVKTATIVAGETSTTTFINRELPGLRIVKYDLTTHQPMPGITFEIYKDGTSIGRRTTDAMGEILLTNLEPGTYLVKEVSTDDAHVVNSTPQEIELQAGDGIRELVFFNQKKPGIRLIKLDSVTMQPLPNVRFAFKQKDGNYQWEYTTDEHGEIDLSKLEPGAYEVWELEAPEGYLMDDSVRYIQINPDDNASLVFTNTPKPKLRIVKVSSDGTPLAGVQFRIARIEDGTHYLDRTTDERGEILIDGMVETLLEPGVYSIRETATTSDHILDLREFHVELFPGKVSTLVIENQRRPNLVVIKRDADTGEVIKDTVFEVRAADGHSVDEIRTDKDGRATLENLLPGVYEVKEKSVPADWLLDAPSQLVTLYANRDHTVYFENHRKPSLTVNKIDSVTGDPVKGAKFEVWYGSNNTSTGELNSLGYYYSDENGQFTLTRLRDGWYRVREIEPPTGYSIKDPDTQDFYIKGGEQKVITFEDTPLSALVVYKYDNVTGEAVKNAVFQVKYLGGMSGTGGTVIGTYLTSANGSFTVTGLKAGTYIVEELASDSGHVIDAAPQTVYISGEEQDVVILYFGNAPKGSVLIKKIDSITRAPLSDVRFFITDADGKLLGNANGYFTTDSAGTILLENLDPGLTVIAKEAAAKDGYILDDTPQTVKVKSGETVTLEFRNTAKGALIVQKYDSVTKEPLPGAEFKITTASGELVPDNEGLTSSNGLYVTDAQGQIVLSKLNPGTYVVTETKAPDNYKPDGKPQTVVVGPADTQTLSFYNEPLAVLTILKRDATTLKPLAKAVFSVKYGNGQAVGANNGRYTTDADGVATVTGIEPNATVIVTEETAPTGYIKDATPKTVVVRSGAANTLVFDNEASTTLIIRKFIEGTENEPLSGVAFKVVDGAGAAIGPDDGVYYTDKAGEIVLSGLEPGTTVIAREIKTVEGFVLDGTPQDILIKAGEAQHLTFWNRRAGTLIIRKLDSITKAPISGAQFSVIYADGRFVDNANGHLSSNGLYTTNANGEIIISGLTGTVVVTEEKAPDGYILDPDSRTQTVTVNPDDTQTLVFYNTPVGGLVITKSDEETGARISGVQFEVRKMNGEIVGQYTTDRNGTIQLPGLESGWYTVTELKAASGYLLDSTAQSVEVKDGQTATLALTNRKTSRVLIHKIDANTGKGIYGVTFVLYDANHNPIGEYVSDQDGYVYMDDGLADGRYYVREIKAADGYILDNELKTIYVRYGATSEITWKNTAIRGQIQIVKKSANDNPINGLPAGTPLEGAVFEIYDKAGNVVDTIRTDRNGRAASSLLPLSRYTVKEVSAPAYYAINPTVMNAYLEHEGQIVSFEVLDESVATGVAIKKTGYAEVMPGQPIRYTVTGVANTSTVALSSFYWRDTLPGQITLTQLVTGTYNQQLAYKIVYKTNTSGGSYRTLADNLSTTKNYVLDARPATLGLAANERVTEIMYVFGTVKAGFAEVETAYVYGTVNSGLSNGSSIVNVADVGGLYNGQWIMAVSRWNTRVYAKTTPLPKTGY